MRERNILVNYKKGFDEEVKWVNEVELEQLSRNYEINWVQRKAKEKLRVAIILKNLWKEFFKD